MFEKLTSPAEVRRWPGRLPVANRYTAGLAGERFFRALKDRGVILATRCDDCGVVYCPAKAFCERCLGGLNDYLEVGPGGTLESFTIVYLDLDENPLSEPAVIGLVRIDGTDSFLVHRISEDSKAALEIGMRVEPKLKPKSERTGSLGDILHFKPVTGPRR